MIQETLCWIVSFLGVLIIDAAALWVLIFATCTVLFIPALIIKGCIMVSPFKWAKTLFIHKATGDVSMSKVGVLLFSAALAFSIVWGAIHPDKVTWVTVAYVIGGGCLALFIAVTNRKDSRKTKVSFSKEHGVSIEQDFEEPKDRQ